MRMMMQMTIPVEAGNEAACRGSFGPPFQKILESLKPEAAYFFAGETGQRGGIVVFDMKDTSEIPGIAEQFFLNFNASVRFTPVMSAADLAKAAPGIEKAVKQHAAMAGA